MAAHPTLKGQPSPSCRHVPSKSPRSIFGPASTFSCNEHPLADRSPRSGCSRGPAIEVVVDPSGSACKGEDSWQITRMSPPRCILLQHTRPHRHVDGMLKILITFSSIKVFQESRSHSPHPIRKARGFPSPSPALPGKQRIPNNISSTLGGFFGHFKSLAKISTFFKSSFCGGSHAPTREACG